MALKESSTAGAKAAGRAVLQDFRHRKLKKPGGEVITDANAALSLALKEGGQPNAKFLRRREHSGQGGKDKPRQKVSKRSTDKRR